MDGYTLSGGGMAFLSLGFRTNMGGACLWWGWDGIWDVIPSANGMERPFIRMGNG